MMKAAADSSVMRGQTAASHPAAVQTNMASQQPFQRGLSKKLRARRLTRGGSAGPAARDSCAPAPPRRRRNSARLVGGLQRVARKSRLRETLSTTGRRHARRSHTLVNYVWEAGGGGAGPWRGEQQLRSGREQWQRPAGKTIGPC